MSGRAYVQTREGQVVEVKPSEVKARLESGDYLPATAADKAEADKREANSTLGAKAKTFAESAAAGAIDAAQAPIVAPVRLGAAALGYDDPFKDVSGRKTVENAASIFGEIKGRLTGENRTGESYGREYGENARGRAEENPGTAMAGNLTGALATGGALAGGARAAGSAVAEGLGGGLAARATGALTAGALEGSAYGSAQAGEDAYLKNIPLTGEKLVSSMGLGAIMGGAVSLGTEGLGALVRRGSRGATPFDSPRLADADIGAAEEAIPGEGTSVSDRLRDFADERTNKALGVRGSDAKKFGRTADKAQAELHGMGRAVRNMTLEDGTPVFQGIQSLDDLSERVATAKQETGARLGAFREKADQVFEQHPEIAPDADAIAKRIRDEIVTPLESHPLSAARAQAAPIAQVADDLERLGAKAANDNSRGVGVSDLTRLRQGLDDQIYQSKRGVNLTQQGAPPNLKDLERARMILEEHIEAATDKASTYFDTAEAQTYKQVKTQYRQLALATEVSGAAQLQQLGNRVVSPSDYGVGAAAAIGHMATGGTGIIPGMLAAAGHKALREHGSAMLAVLADRLANTLDGKIDSGLGAFFKEASQRASAGSMGEKAAAVARAVPIRRAITPAAVTAFTGRHADLQAAYRNRVDDLIAASRDDGSGIRASVQQAMAGGGAATPKLTQAAVVTATTGVNYLIGQIPGGTRAPTVFSPSKRTTPSDLDIRAFAQKWAAVANPLSVLDDLRKGQVTHAQVDAIKSVYPQLYAQIQTTALEKIRELDAKGRGMSFQDRLQLDLFLDLGGAGEPTLAGKFVDRVAGLQAAKQTQQQKKPAASSGALTKISQSVTPASSVLGQG